MRRSKILRLSLVKLATQIERMSSAKLDEVLSSQKPSSDKTGLGYVNSSGLSSSTTSTVFVPQFEKVDKGKKSITDMSNSKTFIRPHSRKSSSSKTTHVCHHCGVFGHTHPNCFKLYPHKQVLKRSQVSSQGSTPFLWELLKALSFLTQFKGNSISFMSSGRHARTYAFSYSQPKTEDVWVRKDSKTLLSSFRPLL